MVRIIKNADPNLQSKLLEEYGQAISEGATVVNVTLDSEVPYVIQPTGVATVYRFTTDGTGAAHEVDLNEFDSDEVGHDGVLAAIGGLITLEFAVQTDEEDTIEIFMGSPSNAPPYNTDHRNFTIVDVVTGVGSMASSNPILLDSAEQLATFAWRAEYWAFMRELSDYNDAVERENIVYNSPLWPTQTVYSGAAQVGVPAASFNPGALYGSILADAGPLDVAPATDDVFIGGTFGTITDEQYLHTTDPGASIVLRSIHDTVADTWVIVALVGDWSVGP